MRRQLLFSMGILFSALFFITPVNAGWKSIINDAVNTINNTKSALEKVQTENEQPTSQERKTDQKPQFDTDEENNSAKSITNTSNTIGSNPSSEPDAVISKNPDNEEITASSAPAALNDAPEPVNKIDSTIIDIDKPGPKSATEEQVKEAESVYEWCIGDYDASRTVDSQCLASEFLDLRMERGPDEPKMSLVADITKRSCRNVEGTSRMEYEKCMVGTSFDYNGIEPEDYCECYAREWGRLLEAYEGQLLNGDRETTLRFKARRYCMKPEAYEGK